MNQALQAIEDAVSGVNLSDTGEGLVPPLAIPPPPPPPPLPGKLRQRTNTQSHQSVTALTELRKG